MSIKEHSGALITVIKRMQTEAAAAYNDIIIKSVGRMK